MPHPEGACGLSAALRCGPGCPVVSLRACARRWSQPSPTTGWRRCADDVMPLAPRPVIRPLQSSPPGTARSSCRSSSGSSVRARCAAALLGLRPVAALLPPAGQPVEHSMPAHPQKHAPVPALWHTAAPTAYPAVLGRGCHMMRRLGRSQRRPRSAHAASLRPACCALPLGCRTCPSGSPCLAPRCQTRSDRTPSA